MMVSVFISTFLVGLLCWYAMFEDVPTSKWHKGNDKPIIDFRQFTKLGGVK